MIRRLFRLLLLAVCVLTAGRVYAQQETAKGSPGDQGAIRRLFEGNKEGKGLPVYIKSDTLTLNSKKRVFTYEGNVEVLRGDLRMTADVMIGKYDQKNQLETVICEDNVVLTKGEEMRASANRAVYRVPKAIIELTEGPELAREGNVLSADKISVFVDEDRSEAEGNVRVKVIRTEEPGLALPGLANSAKRKKEEE